MEWEVIFLLVTSLAILCSNFLLCLNSESQGLFFLFYVAHTPITPRFALSREVWNEFPKCLFNTQLGYLISISHFKYTKPRLFSPAPHPHTPGSVISLVSENGTTIHWILWAGKSRSHLWFFSLPHTERVCPPYFQNISWIQPSLPPRMLSRSLINREHLLSGIVCLTESMWGFDEKNVL